jgi:molecular chaperone DnaK
VVEVGDGLVEVVATHGDVTLGGDAFDRRILAYILAEIGKSLKVNLESDSLAVGRLREELEKVKHGLSEASAVTMRIPYLTKIRGEAQSYLRKVTREELEVWTGELIRRLEPACLAALAAAELRPEDIDRVLLVGGMTRMPAVASAIERIFARPPTQAPNPEEVVALGAATHGALLGGRLKGALLLDVTSRALGIQAGDGRYEEVIPRNATLPTREHKIIPTSLDGQRELTLMVYEGDSPDPLENRHLGSFVLGGLPEAPRGEVLVLVDFTVDVNGILSVSAKDLSSGTRAEVRLTATCGLSRRQVSELRRAHRDRLRE